LRLFVLNQLGRLHTPAASAQASQTSKGVARHFGSQQQAARYGAHRCGTLDRDQAQHSHGHHSHGHGPTAPLDHPFSRFLGGDEEPLLN